MGAESGGGMTETTDIGTARERLLDAALGHAIFDGWSDVTFRAAASDAGIDLPVARVLCPRGAADLAADYHRKGDAEMRRRMAETDLTGLRYRDRVALAIRLRLEAADRELVRRGAALFALPQHAALGARLIWGTADAIWTALGDTSRDFNWYSKRATLSAVYSATALFWLGDEGEGSFATWDFLDRRIDDVMRFEKAKAQFRENPLGRALAKGPLRILDRINAPTGTTDLPGRTGE